MASSACRGYHRSSTFTCLAAALVHMTGIRHNVTPSPEPPEAPAAPAAGFARGSRWYLLRGRLQGAPHGKGHAPCRSFGKRGDMPPGRLLRQARLAIMCGWPYHGAQHVRVHVGSGSVCCSQRPAMGFKHSARFRRGICRIRAFSLSPAAVVLYLRVWHARCTCSHHTYISAQTWCNG